MIPAGRYNAIPVSFGLVDPKGDGRQQFLIEFEITRTGQIIDWYGALNPEAPPGSDRSALEITVESLRALGWEGNNLLEVDFPKGAEAQITIAHDTYRGRTRAKVVRVSRSSLDRFASDQGAARELASKLAGHVANVGRGIGNSRHDAGGDDFPPANYDQP